MIRELEMDDREAKNSELRRYLSPVSVWALSFGASVGWGCFVMPGTLFLPAAGPIGTAIGIILGAIVMFVIGANYHYMMNRYGGAGGTYTYTKKIFGYDHGYLSAWFVVLTYMAIVWANATALALIAKKLFGDVFKFGFHYNVAGYNVFLGDVLLSIGALIICGIICMYKKSVAAAIQTVLALILIVGVIIVFIAVFTDNNISVNLEPLFGMGEKKPGSIFGIIALAPWAFIGFESVSNSVGEFKFKPKKSMLIMAAALTTGVIAYTFMTEIAAANQPSGFATWPEYIRAIEDLSGFEGIPTFFVVHSALGTAGAVIIGLMVFAGIITGIIGNLTAASRLLYSMAKDGLMPKFFLTLSKDGSPKNVILFLTLISCVLPLFGRTAIGWIVDVTTIGASIAYGYTSAAVIKCAKEKHDRLYYAAGIFGVAMSVLFSLYLLIPNVWSISGLADESYLILAIWSVLGFVFFRITFEKDKEKRLGKSTVAWVALLFLIFFTTLLWVLAVMQTSTSRAMDNISGYYEEEFTEMGISRDERLETAADEYLTKQMNEISGKLMEHSLMQMAIIVLTLIIMFSIYSIISKREKQAEEKKFEAEESNKAKSVFLSNMSHDIRTPMNAIVGYTTLAKKEQDVPPHIMDYLNKIETSSAHLLALINDVLEMSRIESGRMELEPVPTDLVKTMNEVRDMFATQMTMKSIRYEVVVENVTNPVVLCDKNRLNRVLLNLISNAYKFTPEGGSVKVRLRQNGEIGWKGLYELRVSDSGIGMSSEFAAKVFDAFERENTSTVSGIQGTGLGMAITKSIVDLMDGTIEVHTNKGRGTEFELHLEFEIVDEEYQEKFLRDGIEADDKRSSSAQVFEDDGTGGRAHPVRRMPKEIDFKGMRVLLAEDNAINQEIAKAILLDAGFLIDVADNGEIAVEMLTEEDPGYYDLILMDVQMPVMGGYDATRVIRALPDKELADIPIIAMTANAFAEDVMEAKEAGMDAHVAKPIDIPVLMKTIREVLERR